MALAAVALIMAIRGYLNIAAEHGGGSVLVYLFEAGLPALLFAGLVGIGIVLWRKGFRAA